MCVRSLFLCTVVESIRPMKGIIGGNMQRKMIAFGRSIRIRGTIALMILSLNACATHTAPLTLDSKQAKQIRTIGLPLFEDQKRIDVRRENPVYAVIGMTAKAMQQLIREHNRIEYQDANPSLHQYCTRTMRNRIRTRLRKLGYRVRDLNMTYWKAQSGYRRGDPRLKRIDALLDVRIKRFGYFSGSPFKPYRPGMVVTADLISTDKRKILASNVYNVGYDRADVPMFQFKVNYMTHIHVADKRYFYRNIKALMAHAKASGTGLKFITKVAAESIAGDLKPRASAYQLANNH